MALLTMIALSTSGYAAESQEPPRMENASRIKLPAAVTAAPKHLTGIDTKQTPPPDLSEWDQRWHRLQTAPQDVTLHDHWLVCELKFRFRNYRELFKCLDLIEARVGHLDEDAPQRRYAPVIVGWMRAAAYAELGQTEEAVRFADLAWAALPQAYREVSGVVFECADALVILVLNPCKLASHNDAFATVAIEAGGSHWRHLAQEITSETYDTSEYAGNTNPAGLDLRPQAIVMSLAAQRSVLHAQRGEMQIARAALDDLNRWAEKDHAHFGSWLGTQSRPYLFTDEAWSLAPGPLFALQDYASVVKVYDAIAFSRDRTKRSHAFAWAFPPRALLAATSSLGDARKFAVSLEDASNGFLYATSLARLGATDRAEQSFDTIVAAPAIREMGNIYWAALYERSQIALRKGQRAEAIRFLQQAVEAIEQVRNTINFESGKIGFATSKQAVYAALVGALTESGDWKGAFEAAERAKARALVDLLAQTHDLAPSPEAGEKVRQLLAGAAVNDAEIGFPVSAEAVATRNLIATARYELPRVAPEAASLVSVQTASVDDIATKLAPTETLIDYFAANADLYAFLLKGAAVTGFKLRGEGLDEEVRAFRQAIETGDASADERGRALYDRLIRPLAEEIQGSKLTVSAHGVLHYLPFAALRDGDQYLIDRYSLRVTPSASALVYLRTDTPEKPGKVLAWGNPDLGDARYDLPNAQREALKVAQLFPASRALLRQEASKTAVKELGNSFAILHFASHGVFDPDAPLTSGLLLAKGSEADGRLTVSDLYSMRLDVQLVTLSACQTGLGKVLSGDDVMGLTRGFLYAGARSIVASLWSVDDAATAELMVSFYQNLASHEQREALRLAQIETRKTHPNPLYWAAFEITGSAK